MRYVVQIREEKNTVGTGKNKYHTTITIPHEWLIRMGLTGDKYDRTADVTYDATTQTITIRKAAF